MKTIIYPPPGVFGFGRSRTVHIPDRPLSPGDGASLVTTLAGWGIPLRVSEVGPVIHLHALAPISTADEVRALRAFAVVTDARLVWHGAVAS